MISNHLLSIAIACIAAISGCSNADTGGIDSQVVARVNGKDIVLQQVRNAIGPQISEMSPEHLEKVAAHVLDELIDEELLVQSALATALDREPAVQQSIDVERRRILALAYIAWLAPAAPPSSVEEVRQFYLDNPALFKQRRIYQIHKLFGVVSPKDKTRLKAKLATVTNLTEIAHWFAAQRIEFKETAETVAAESIPANILQGLATMRDGQIAVIELPKLSELILVLQLIRATDASISEIQAAAQIEQTLARRWRAGVGLTAIKRLRNAASIEYPAQFEAPAPAGDDESMSRLKVHMSPGSGERRPDERHAGAL